MYWESEPSLLSTALMSASELIETQMYVRYRLLPVLYDTVVGGNGGAFALEAPTVCGRGGGIGPYAYAATLWLVNLSGRLNSDTYDFPCCLHSMEEARLSVLLQLCGVV
jgi:hypothetical protein